MNTTAKRLGYNSYKDSGITNANIQLLINDNDDKTGAIISVWKILIDKYYRSRLAVKSGMNSRQIFSAYISRLEREIRKLSEENPDTLNWSLAEPIDAPFLHLLSPDELSVANILTYPTPQQQIPPAVQQESMRHVSTRLASKTLPAK
jgi:hypothetical protein